MGITSSKSLQSGNVLILKLHRQKIVLSRNSVVAQCSTRTRNCSPIKVFQHVSYFVLVPACSCYFLPRFSLTLSSFFLVFFRFTHLISSRVSLSLFPSPSSLSHLVSPSLSILLPSPSLFIESLSIAEYVPCLFFPISHPFGEFDDC